MFKLLYLISFVNIHMVLVSDFKRVCYIRADPKIPVDYVIEEKLCSHLIIGFVSVADNSILIDETNDKFYKRCKTTIEVSNSETVLMLSIGGGNEEKGFHSSALTHINRKKFANNALEVMNRYGFDGLDLDWEFPDWDTEYYQDKHNFNLLIKEIRDTFSNYTSNHSIPRLLISVAVAAQYSIIDTSYDVPELVKYVDFINLMTYDYYTFHWYWPFVGHNSPLFGRILDLGPLGYLNTEWSVNYWNRLGANKSQLMVGIPTYGRSFRLAYHWFTIPGSLVLDSSEDMNYSQICLFLRTNGTKVAFDTESQIPYAFRDDVWLTYESEYSAVQKVNWTRVNGFGGVMIFSLNADDFSNQCNDDLLFPIHSAIRTFAFN